jgi:putative flippase GtrA
MKYMNNEYVRFIIAGIINVISTYVLYLLFLTLLNYIVSYTLSYIFGIAISYYLNSSFVFHTSFSWKKALQYPTVYVVQYIIGAACLYVFVKLLHLAPTTAPFLVMMITIPIVFVMSRFILKGDQHNPNK